MKVFNGRLGRTSEDMNKQLMPNLNNIINKLPWNKSHGGQKLHEDSTRVSSYLVYGACKETTVVKIYFACQFASQSVRRAERNQEY